MLKSQKSKGNTFKKEKFKKNKTKSGIDYMAPSFIRNHMDLVKVCSNSLFIHNENYYSIVFSYKSDAYEVESINNFMTDLRIIDCSIRFINNYFDESVLMVVSFVNFDVKELDKRVETIISNIEHSANSNKIELTLLDSKKRINKYIDFISKFYEVDTSKSFIDSASSYLASMYDSSKKIIIDNGDDWFKSDVNHKYYRFMSIYKYPYEFVDFDNVLLSLQYIKVVISEMTPISDYNFVKNWDELYVGKEGLIKRIQRNNPDLYEVYSNYVNAKKKKFNDARTYCYLSKTYLIEADTLDELEEVCESFRKLHKSVNNLIHNICFCNDALLNVCGGLSNHYSLSNVLIKSKEIGKFLIPYKKENENNLEMLKNYFMN